MTLDSLKNLSPTTQRQLYTEFFSAFLVAEAIGDRALTARYELQLSAMQEIFELPEAEVAKLREDVRGRRDLLEQVLNIYVQMINQDMANNFHVS